MSDILTTPTLHEAILQHECPTDTFDSWYSGFHYRLYVIRLHCLDVVVMTEGEGMTDNVRIMHLSYEDQGYSWSIYTSNGGITTPEVKKGKLLRECEHCGGIA